MKLVRREVLKSASAALIAGAAPRSAWGNTQADVVVIGAGLAGLFAAHKLEVAGLKSILIEAEGHVGGRTRTLDDLPGHPDAGGIQVGSGYRRLRDIAHDLKVKLVAGGELGRSALYRINGETVSHADWPTSTANLLPPGDHARSPLALGMAYAAKLPKLIAPENWTDRQMLQRLDMPYEALLKELGASDEARRLIAANFNGNSLATMSALHLERSAAIFRARPGPLLLVADGTQRIAEAMAGAIKSPIRLKQIVHSISERRDGVTVRLANGKDLRARQVVCTIPFSALRDMNIDADLNPAVRTMIGRLPYTRASFAYLQASAPFWRDDGQPETLWSDDPLLGRAFVLGDDPPMLKVWIPAAGADRMDAMPEEAVAHEIISRYEAARRSSTGKLRMLKYWSWQKNPFARGIYHHIGAGDGVLLAEAVLHKGKRLHFAGEHLAISASGMEGALESGERAARAILER